MFSIPIDRLVFFLFTKNGPSIVFSSVRAAQMSAILTFSIRGEEGSIERCACDAQTSKG